MMHSAQLNLFFVSFRRCHFYCAHWFMRFKFLMGATIMSHPRHYLCINSTSTNEKKNVLENRTKLQTQKIIIQMFGEVKKKSSGRNRRIALSSVTACVWRILCEIDVEQKSIEIIIQIVFSSFNIFSWLLLLPVSFPFFNMSFLFLLLQIVCRAIRP